MATKEIKEWALIEANGIIYKAAEGGYGKSALSIELQNLYNQLVLLKEDSEKDD